MRVTDINNSTDTIPLTYVDWFHYGGIIRSVEIEELNDIWIKSMKVDYALDAKLENAVVSADIEVEAFNGTMSNTLKLYINDTLVSSKSITVNKSKKITFDNISVRKMRGLSQEKLAELAHVSRSHISAIEAPGIAHPFSLEVFFNISDALEVDPADLINASVFSNRIIENKE